LLAELVRRDVRARFAGARVGLLWSLLNPLVQLVSYGAIFLYFYVAPASTTRAELIGSLFCGLWPWWAFQEAVTRGTSALVDQASLLRRLPVPPELCVAAAVTASFLLQMIGFTLFLVAGPPLGFATVSSCWLLLPGIALLGWALRLGVARTLAPINLMVRDTAYVVAAAMTVGFFASPVLYSVDSLPATVARAAELNPVAGLIGLYRYAALDMPPPSLLALVSLGGAIAGLWICGGWLLERSRDRLDEFL
jgi:ABC-type polysaccharide/polyol phosphate export permease